MQETTITKAPHDVELAWAAGFLDGEGWFGLDRQRTPSIEAVQVATDEPLLRLQSYFGGSVCRKKQRSRPWHWRMASKPQALDALLLLLPYLVVKRAKAEVLLRFCLTGKPRGDSRYSPVEQLMRDSIQQELEVTAWRP